MPGNGEFELKRKVVDGGGNKQNAGNDSLITEKSGETGAAKSVTKPIGNFSLTPDGQQVK